MATDHISGGVPPFRGRYRPIHGPPSLTSVPNLALALLLREVGRITPVLLLLLLRGHTRP